jgi:hypothetical protein
MSSLSCPRILNYACLDVIDEWLIGRARRLGRLKHEQI